MTNKKNRIIATLATGVMLCTMVAIPNAQGESVLTSTGIVQTVDASADGVVRGCFNRGVSWSGYTNVVVYNERKRAKIKICSFRQNGKINGGKFTVEVTADGGYNRTYNINGSGYITLNEGYSNYRIRIKRRNDYSTNIAKTIYWSIDGTTNCRVR